MLGVTVMERRRAGRLGSGRNWWKTELAREGAAGAGWRGSGPVKEGVATHAVYLYEGCVLD